MSVLKVLVLVFSICCTLYFTNAAFSEKQLASAKKMITNICKPRVNATDEDLEGMRSGVFSRPAMQNKDNTFNLAGGLATMKMLPEEFHESGQKLMEVCKDSAKTLDDKCVAAMEIGKCFYENSDDKLRKFMS